MTPSNQQTVPWAIPGDGISITSPASNSNRFPEFSGRLAHSKNSSAVIFAVVGAAMMSLRESLAQLDDQLGGGGQVGGGPQGRQVGRRLVQDVPGEVGVGPLQPHDHRHLE